MRASRIIAGLGAGLIGVVGFAVITSRSEVQAHGGMTFPATRTYACYKNGRDGSGGGDLLPTNQACQDAIAQGGKQPLWDWFGNLLSNAGPNSRQVVADGKLCGPSDKYAAYNMARADWPTTNVQAGAQVTFRYNAWAPHPGTWTQWVTRDGFDVTQPLKWSDLEAQPFDQITNPPINGSGPEGAEYTWSARLPNKSGRHIIYSIWTRSDSPEVFYNCSDVVFGGGGGTTPTTPAPTTTRPAPTTAAPTTVAPTTTRPLPSTIAPTTTTSRPAPTTTTTTPDGHGAPVPVTCSATPVVNGAWGGYFWSTVTVRNTTATPVNDWRVNLRLAPGAALLWGWNATFTNLSVAPAARNATIPPGGSVTFGFFASGPASPAPVVSGCTAQPARL